MAISPVGAPTAAPMIVGRLLLEVVVEFRWVSTGSVGAALSLEAPDATGIAGSLELFGDVSVAGSFGGIGTVLLIVTVMTEGSVESVGEIVITDVLTSFIGGATGLVEVEVVAISSVITDVLNSLMNGTGPGLVAPVVESPADV